MTMGMQMWNIRQQKFETYLKLYQLEAVACKDWLTNKVDRCVGGRGWRNSKRLALAAPLNNCGVMALDYQGVHGIATSVGHAPAIALIDEKVVE